jgi:hypothetical protein
MNSWTLGPSLPKSRPNFIVRDSRGPQRDNDVIQQVGGFFSYTVSVVIGTGDDKLCSFLPDFFEPQVPIAKEPLRIAGLE